MAQGTAGVKTFGSGKALKVKSWKCSREAGTRGNLLPPLSSFACIATVTFSSLI